MKKKDRNGLSLAEFLKEELADPEVRKHFEAAKAEWLVAKMVATARKRAHLTQDQLAKRLKTDQKAIWRLEAGQQNATVDMLWRIAAAQTAISAWIWCPGGPRPKRLAHLRRPHREARRRPSPAFHKSRRPHSHRPDKRP